MLLRVRFLALSLGAFAVGCAQVRLDPAEADRLQERAWDCLKRGISYEYLTTVRVQAIEALHEVGGDEVLPWIRHALHDEQPAVRFAACLALGARRDQVAAPRARTILNSSESSDRIGAIFVLHRLGETGHAAELATYLLEDEDPATRSNTALALGRLGEPGAVKLLARVMDGSDLGLRSNALESMALRSRRCTSAVLIRPGKIIAMWLVWPHSWRVYRHRSPQLRLTACAPPA